MENNSHSYKKLSHFSDYMLKMSNEPNKIIPYSDKQFEEDLQKWKDETTKSNRIRVDTITTSLGKDYEIKKKPPIPQKIISPFGLYR